MSPAANSLSRSFGYGMRVTGGVPFTPPAVEPGSPFFVLARRPGESTKIVTSADGVTWTPRTSGLDSVAIYTASIARSPNEWIANLIQESGDPTAPSIVRSTNGTVWTMQAAPNYQPFACASSFANDAFFLPTREFDLNSGGAFAIGRSVDGTSWANMTPTPEASFRPGSGNAPVVHFNGAYWTFEETQLTQPLRSTTGLAGTWARGGTGFPNAAGSLYGCACDGTTLVIGGSSGRFYRTTNGTAWTAITLPGNPTMSAPVAVAYAGGLFYAYSRTNTQNFVSADGGVTWFKLPTNSIYAQAVAASHGVWVIISKQGLDPLESWVSTDGYNFKNRATIPGAAPGGYPLSGHTALPRFGP